MRLSGHLLTACPTLAQDAQEQELLPARERLGQRTGMNAWGLGESRAAQRSVPPPITGPSIPTRCRGLSTSWALLSSGPGPPNWMSPSPWGSLGAVGARRMGSCHLGEL